MSLINASSDVFIIGLTQITGSLFLSVLAIIMGLMVIAFALRIPIEFTAVFILPFLLVLMSYDGAFLSVGGALLIYLGVLVGKNFFFQR